MATKRNIPPQNWGKTGFSVSGEKVEIKSIPVLRGTVGGGQGEPDTQDRKRLYVLLLGSDTLWRV